MKPGELGTFTLRLLIFRNAKHEDLALNRSPFLADNVEQEDLAFSVRLLSMHFYYAVNATARTIGKV